MAVSAPVVAMQASGHAGSLPGNGNVGCDGWTSARVSMVAHPLKTALRLRSGQASGGAASNLAMPKTVGQPAQELDVIQSAPAYSAGL